MELSRADCCYLPWKPVATEKRRMVMGQMRWAWPPEVSHPLASDAGLGWQRPLWGRHWILNACLWMRC